MLAGHDERPWDDPFDTGRPPRTETDEITLHRLREFLERAAGDAGWRTGAGGSRPTDRDVSWAFSGSRALMALCGLLDEDGDWSAQRYRLTPAGETLVSAMLRATAAGPRDHP